MINDNTKTVASATKTDLDEARKGLLAVREKHLLVALDPMKPKAAAQSRAVDVSDGEGWKAAGHWIKAMQARKRNVYFHANPVRDGLTRKAAKNDMLGCDMLQADLDPDGDGTFNENRKALLDRVKALREGPNPPTVLIDSGNGFNALWRLETPLPVGEFERVNRAFNEGMGAKGTFNADRILKVAGTKAWPSAAKLKRGYPEIAQASLIEVTDTVMGDDAQPIPTTPKQAGTVQTTPKGRFSGGDEPEGLAEKMADLRRSTKIDAAFGDGTGDRSATLQTLAAAMKAAGWTPEEYSTAVLGHTTSAAGHVLDQADPERALERAWDRTTAEPRKAARDEFPMTSNPAASAGVRANFSLSDLSHDDLALGLGIAGWDRDAKHVAAWNKWFLWDGVCWRVDQNLKHFTLCREYLRRIAAGLKLGDAKIIRSKATVMAVADMARSNPDSVAAPDDFDSDLMLLGAPDGTVDLKTGTLRPARRRDMITKTCAVGPAPVGTAPVLWLEFLDRVLGGDADLIGFVQRLCGYALTGQTTEHKLAFLFGTGRNGKSVFLDTLQWIMADYARRSAAETFLATNATRHATGIAKLVGARLVVSSELPKGRYWNESVIKDLTGGDRQSANFMRQDEFEFDPQLMLFIAGNSKPRLREVGVAIKDRIMLVPFTVTIPKADRDLDLKDKLRAEGPAILRWMIDGCLEWQKQGLAVPAAVSAASTEYFEQEDKVGLFIEDEIEEQAGAYTSGDDLVSAFNGWCDRQGIKRWSKAALIEDLTGNHGFKKGRRNNTRGVRGLVLKSSDFRDDFAHGSDPFEGSGF